MTTKLAADTHSPHDQRRSRRAATVKVFLALLAVGFLLRIFYAGHLYQDDGLWFTAAEEVVRGKALYRDIYFDKPPGLPLLYALLFKLFGAHILTIRLFTIFYSLAVSAALYVFGRWIYDRRAGLLAAAMFTVFSTTYTTGHVQGLNSDFLMALPYTVGAYLLARSQDSSRAGRLLALAGGGVVAVAFQVNPKAIFDLVFFALLLVITRRWAKGEGPKATVIFASALAGFAIITVAVLSYIAATGSLGAYWLYVWDWGARYAGYYPLWQTIRLALGQSAGYFALNNTLLAALCYVVAVTISSWRARSAEKDHPALLKADVTLLLWLAASYAGLAVGGRFFGHYFFQIIPALCLIGARGLLGIIHWLNRQPGWKRRAALALLIIGFAGTLARFHGRTALLAFDWAQGAKSATTAGWFHERLNREERTVAEVVKGVPEDERSSDAAGSGDHLFVWGYRPEIYYWSGLLPASGYLSTQPLTGVPADVHYFGSGHRQVLDETQTAAARARLVRELEQTEPRYIVDELGFFNSELSINQYPEIREFMEGYKLVGVVERFVVYRKKGPHTLDRLEKRARKRAKRGLR